MVNIRPRPFNAAQVRAARLAAALETRIKTRHRDVTWGEAAMAFALVLRKMDTELGSGRALQDLAIVAMGGVNSIDWNALQKLPESSKDVLDADGADDVVNITSPGEKGDAL